VPLEPQGYRQIEQYNRPTRQVCSWDELAGESEILKREPIEVQTEAEKESRSMVCFSLENYNLKERSPQ